MKEVLLVALLSVVWSLQPIGTADVAHVKTPKTPKTAAPAPEARANDDGNVRSPPSSASVSDGAGGDINGTSPCDRYLRSAEVEVRKPRNHKFVTSNGWAERQRPRPEISVYSRVEEIPPPQPPAATAAFYHQQQDSSFYQHSRQQQQPAVQRTSKRIIYYATLPDVIRAPAGYPPPAAADPYALGPGPFSADFRQLQQDSSRKAPPDSLQRNRLTSYENTYNRGGVGGGGGNGVTSVTSKTTALYNSRYDEPAEFRESYYRPNELTSKYASWAEPFYKSWTSSPWDKDRTSFSNNNRGSPTFSWDREPLTRGGGSWDREPLNRGSGGSWDREPLGGDGGSPWDNRGSSWDNRGSSWDNRGATWDKDLVEVPLQKPNRGGVDGGGGGGSNNLFNNNKYPEVAVVHSGVIDVRGDGQQNRSPHPAPPPRFTIIDVDPKPYREQQPPTMRYDERSKPMVQPNVRYEPQQKPMRYEAYMPMQPHTRFEQQQPMSPPPSMRYEQQYRSPQQQQQSPPTTRYGQQQQQQHQSQNNQPSNGYYESIKNNINTHQFMTSWTEVSTQDEVSPTHSVSIDIASVGNSTSTQNSTRITPNTNTTKIPK
ncbi:uncharacterized protein DDB_G0283357-like isoform X2 [Rhopalosiphum maidis]|nr:uncharacterized protein DDB_G0283357-like isoform X2 [Rhopalosiphum maidis]